MALICTHIINCDRLSLPTVLEKGWRGVWNQNLKSIVKLLHIFTIDPLYLISFDGSVQVLCTVHDQDFVAN